jgi:hypothetical protein
MYDSVKKFFAYKRRDEVLDDFTAGTATETIVHAYGDGNISAVRERTCEAYQKPSEARKVEAGTKDIWFKPASWGRQDRLTFYAMVISLVIKVSAIWLTRALVYSC